MISLQRKAELLANHVKAIEAMDNLTSIGYLESKSIQELTCRFLFETGRISEEEKVWLVGQLADQSEGKESIEAKKSSKTALSNLGVFIPNR